MKKLLLALMVGAVISPSMVFAETSDDMSPPPSHEMQMDQEMHGDMPPPPRHEKGERPHKKMKDLSDAEKEAFFERKMTQMEGHVKKIQSDLDELKTLSTAEKEEWFKAKKAENRGHKRMKGKKGNHKNMRGKCEKINDLSAPKSPEEAMTRLKESKRYQSASAEKQAEMVSRVEKFSSMSPEDRQAHFDKKKEKMNSMCSKLDNKKSLSK